MPKECESGHNAHQVDEDDSRKLHIALPLPTARIKSVEQVQESKLIQKVEELLEQPRFPETVDLGDLFAFCELFGNAGLIPMSRCPTEALEDFL
ncbi:MAG: hypothetical protein JSW28_06460 [Thermoplasmata archaeon]|nr:MAG: hypothetical protein JSW28_06460 [Thermoplasmata archaeon]